MFRNTINAAFEANLQSLAVSSVVIFGSSLAFLDQDGSGFSGSGSQKTPTSPLVEVISLVDETPSVQGS